MKCIHEIPAGSYYDPMPWVDCDLTDAMCVFWMGKDECIHEEKVNE